MDRLFDALEPRVGRGGSQAGRLHLERVAGATQYLFEFEGGPRGGRLGGNLTVPGTTLPVVIPATVPAGPYRVRVLGLSATGAPVGTFSSVLTFTIAP